MPQAIGDPEQMRRFAARLRSFNATLSGELDDVRAAFNSVSESWRDEKRRDFEGEFEQAASQLRRFIEQGEESARHIDGLAEDLEQYLSR